MFRHDGFYDLPTGAVRDRATRLPFPLPGKDAASGRRRTGSNHRTTDPRQNDIAGNDHSGKVASDLAKNMLVLSIPMHAG